MEPAMILRTLFFAAVFYIISLFLLTVWPAYTDFWAQVAYAAAGVTAPSWTTWATAAEWGRLLVVAGLGAIVAWLAGRWADDAAATTATETGDAATQNRALAISRVLDALGRSRGRQRLEILEDRCHRLPDGLTTDEAVALLGPLRSYDRKAGINLLAHKLADDVDLNRLTASLNDYQRADVMKRLP